MNLFWKKTFGGLTPTDKLEKEEADLLLAYKRYCEIETSEQLKEYTQLFHIVKSAAFKEKKKTLQFRKFKDTQEYRDYTKYERLHNSVSLKLYYHVVDSPELKDFLAFKATGDYEKLGKPKLVRKDPVLKKYALYDRSKAYKTYIRFHNSFIVTEYEKLKKLVATEEFQKNKAWWEDSHRWTKTEEYKQEARYNELRDTPDISFYESTDPKKFDKIDEWILTFEDTFQENTLDAKKWQNGYYHRAKTLKKVYSFANEKQANTDGDNIVLSNNLLKIITMNEKKESSTWNPQLGFVTKEFNYTSGLINSGAAFQQQYGLIKAKLRIAGSKDISHACWLGTDGKLPHVNVFCYNGKNIIVNNYAQEGGSVTAVKEPIKGINPTDFYIYSLEWTPRELIWKVNNVEVFRSSKAVPQESMYVALSSFIAQKQQGGQGSLDVDWIRVFKK